MHFRNIHSEVDLIILLALITYDLSTIIHQFFSFHRYHRKHIEKTLQTDFEIYDRIVLTDLCLGKLMGTN